MAVTVNPSPVNFPPTVSAGADQTITLPAKASLGGAAADDKQPAGGRLTARLEQGERPRQVTFAKPRPPSTTAAFSAAGDIRPAGSTASDSGLTTADDVTVTVLPVNQPPVVKAGADQTVNFPSAARLGGTATDDGQPPGGQLTLVWSKVSGPGEVNFADAGAAATRPPSARAANTCCG